MGARAEVDVAAGQGGEFGDPQPGVDGEQQQRVVAPAEPGGASGAASSASISAPVRKHTPLGRSVWVGWPVLGRSWPACSGGSSAAYRNREWIAARRALRVATLLPGAVSRLVRNAVISSASSWARSSRCGAVAVVCEAKPSSSRQVSR